MKLFLTSIAAYLVIGLASYVFCLFRTPKNASPKLVLTWPFFVFGMSVAIGLILWMKLVGKEQASKLVSFVSEQNSHKD